MSSLEDALMDKDKAMDRLKEQRERYNKEHEEQVEGYKKQLKDLRTRLETVQKELAEKEVCVNLSWLAAVYRNSILKTKKLSPLENMPFANLTHKYNVAYCDVQRYYSNWPGISSLKGQGHF